MLPRRRRPRPVREELSAPTWSRRLLTAVRRRSRSLPHSVIGWESYLDVLSASDLAALHERQGGRCPVTNGAFYIPDDLGAPSGDMVSHLAKLARKSGRKIPVGHLPWPVRLDQAEPFMVGNIILVKFLLVDAYYAIGGIRGLRELHTRLPSDDELMMMASPPAQGDQR